MLKVVEGRSIAAWQPSDVEHADVLIAHASGDPATLNAWSLTGKPVVMVIDDRGSWPSTPFMLRYPFRVMQLLSMLDDVAEHLGAAQTGPVGEGSVWAAAESLRRFTTHTSERGWQVARSDHGARLWVGDGLAHALPDTLAQLRDGRVALGAFGATSEGPPPAAQPLPIGDAAWYVGLAAPPGLAPWLEQDTAYRLRRWPDFGRLGALPDMVELSALAASQPCTPSSLARLSGHALADVHRFLAAASLAGLLMAPARSETLAPAPARARPQSGWMRFVGDLRRHLRVAT